MPAVVVEWTPLDGWYDLKRMIAIMGVQSLIEAMRV